MRAVRQNCGSNFSRLARQRKLPVVAARLFFYLTSKVVVGRWTHDPERGKLRVAILVSSQVAVLRGSDVGYMYSNLTSNCNKVWIIVFDFDMVYMWKPLRVNVDAFVFSGFFCEGTVGWGIVGEMRKIGRARCERAIFWIGTESPTWSDEWGIGSRVENRRFF